MPSGWTIWTVLLVVRSSYFNCCHSLYSLLNLVTFIKQKGNRVTSNTISLGRETLESNLTYRLHYSYSYVLPTGCIRQHNVLGSLGAILSTGCIRQHNGLGS
jgi:hypothetical protein